MPTSLFPVNVQAGDQMHSTVRFYGSDGFSELWGLVAGSPGVVVAGAGFVKQGRAVGGERLSDGSKAKWTLTLEDGTVWLAAPAGGCGCSHPLKSFKPERAVRT